jgi:predicted DCC family thiol-disulfide oxidoreductase YuxK
MNHQGDAPVWLFDEVCVLCSGAVRYTLRHEKTPRIRFVAIRSDEGRRIAAHHGIDPDDPNSFLFIEDGVALARSAGVLALVRHLTGPARLLRLGRLLPAGLRDRLYDVVAGNRYRLFGRLQACEMPDPEVRHRFVLPDRAVSGPRGCP